MKAISIYPPKELKEKLLDISKKEGRSFNKQVLFILNKFVEEK